MAAPISRAWTKVIHTDGSAPGYSASWITAQRGWLNIYPDRLECGDIVIPAEAVMDAVLYEARHWFLPVYVLAVTIADGTWQFALNPWARIASHLPFEFRRERVRLRYSAFSIAVRVALLVYFVYWLIRRFMGA
jgi:hypothetical protein